MAEEENMGRLISIAELATRTATCESTWRKAISRGEIPIVRIGRAVRVSEDVAERLIREGTHAKAPAEAVA